MSVSDRDYLRAGAFHERGFTGTPVTWILIVSNFALWLVFAGSASGMYRGTVFRLFEEGLALRPSVVVAAGRPLPSLWQPLTTTFVHDPRSIGPVLWSMAYLFFFGREVERMLGRGSYVALYVGSGVLGSLAALLAARLGVRAPEPFVGAWGSVFGVLAFFACRRPSEPVVASVPAWAFVSALTAGPLAWFGLREGDALFLAHGTGAVAGFLVGAVLPRIAASRARRGMAREAAADAARERSAAADRRRVDALLEKINREGMAALSPEEKAFLDAASKTFR